MSNHLDRTATHRRGISLFASLALVSFGLSGCGGGSAGGGVAGGAFVLLRTEPANNERIFLNQSVRFFFSNPVDLDTVNFNSVAFFPSNSNGPVPEQVVGRFAHGKDEDGKRDPRVLEFVPRLPSNDTYTNGGLRPSRTYLVSLVGGSASSPTVRDVAGRSLSRNSALTAVRLHTVSGQTPAELFLDTRPGGPRLLSVRIGPESAGRVGLNHLGAAPVEVTLRFDQPLNPHSSNMPIDQSLDPERHDERERGRIWLEYDDPELGKRRWIPGDLDLPENDDGGALVVLRPDGVLPNAAQVRVVVAAELEDLSGESNLKSARYEPIAARFRTRDGFESQFDAVVLEFENADLLNPEGRFRDPVATLEDGVLQASFDFDGDPVPWDFEPTTRNLVLSTDITQVPVSNGPPLLVTGGVFRFRDVTINEGIAISGRGTNPFVMIATGSVRIDGSLTASGGNGAFSNTFGSSNIPKAGGAGVCTGGRGGRSSQNQTGSTRRAEPGFGPYNRNAGGGEGGGIACGATNGGWGSGGGGGSHSTFGDPDFLSGDQRADGNGGTGSSRLGMVPGGLRGPRVFTDQFDENDFWGRGIDANGDPIVGEMKAPIGGSGGGGGGDRTRGSQADPCAAQNFFNDFQGGGGGGSGGVIIVQALGRIILGPKSLVAANGGHGAGGYFQGNSSHGGGGGGGSGGMIVLMSASGIDLHQHGGAWKSSGDHDFVVSADGGLTIGGQRGHKYVKATVRPNVGGYGGLGLIQLMTPPGNDSDGTGTVQDDSIRVLDKNLKVLTGAAKTQVLFGGDLRPDPWLLPTPFSRFSQAQTRWIATGATVRRSVADRAAGPRSLLQPGKPGPEYFFAGIEPTGLAAGYLETSRFTGTVEQPVLSFGGKTKLGVARAVAAAGREPGGLLVHELTLDSKVLPADGSLANHRLRLRARAGNNIGEWRIVRHTDSLLRLDAAEGLLPKDIATAEIVAKFFEVVTEGSTGLGRTYEAKVQGKKHRFPIANLQLGFAFHENPARPDVQGKKDRKRWPQELDTFLHDLQSASARETLRDLHYPFIKIQMRFNLNYDHQDPSTNPGPAPVNPRSQRPALRFVRVPYRY